MSKPDDRLAVIEENYKDALDNEPHDLAMAQTAADVTAIQANVATARQIYYSAVAAQLTQGGDDVEAAYKKAQDASKSVREAREKAADIATIISELTSATSAASKLLDAAKKSKS
jgi:deferrochelatase/peroxidase EfeB